MTIQSDAIAGIVPVLETERLILRAPKLEDFEVYNGFYSSERSRFVFGPRDRFENWFSFLALPGHWAMRGYGYWMIEERMTGRLLGAVGIVQHEGWPAPELGWQLFDGEGQGFAAEATIAARNWAAAQGMGELISLITPENTRSIALANRLGAKLMGEGDSPIGPLGLWLHPKGDA